MSWGWRGAVGLQVWVAVPLGGALYGRAAAGRGRKVLGVGWLEIMGKVAIARAGGLSWQVRGGLRREAPGAGGVGGREEGGL